MDSITVTVAAETKYSVTATAVSCLGDVSVTVTGGERPHIGAVSLAVYEPERNSATVSTLTVFTHRDDQIASFMAKELSRATKHTVSVSVGIHIDDPSLDEIAILRRNCQECCSLLIAKLT
jgi:predicted ThiF/HesA family dinucleotide-utilizing enzyme